MGYPVPYPPEPCALCNLGGHEPCYTQLRPGENFCDDFDGFQRAVEECGLFRTEAAHISCDWNYCVQVLEGPVTWSPSFPGWCVATLSYPVTTMSDNDVSNGTAVALAYDYSFDPSPDLFCEEITVTNSYGWTRLATGDGRTRCLFKLDLTAEWPHG